MLLRHGYSTAKVRQWRKERLKDLEKIAKEVMDWEETETENDNEHILNYSTSLALDSSNKTVKVYTVYKQKAQKTVLIDQGDRTRETPRGYNDQYKRLKKRDKQQLQKGEYQDLLISRFLDILRHSRLTPEREKDLKISDLLTTKKRKLLIKILVNREKCIVFDQRDCRKIYHDILPLIVIKIILYNTWQAANFSCPRALQTIVI